MSSQFDELYGEMAVPVLQEHLGEQSGDRVYLTPGGGDQAGPFDCIVGPVIIEEVDTENGLKKRYRRTLQFPFHAELPFWNAGATVGTTITIGGVVWSLDLVEELGESWATARAVRHTPVEVSRPGYRQK